MRVHVFQGTAAGTVQSGTRYVTLCQGPILREGITYNHCFYLSRGRPNVHHLHPSPDNHVLILMKKETLKDEYSINDQ